MGKDVEYDPAVVGRLAKRLYRRAVFVLFFYPAIGVLVVGLNGHTSGIGYGVFIGAADGVFLTFLLPGIQYDRSS